MRSAGRESPSATAPGAQPVPSACGHAVGGWLFAANPSATQLSSIDSQLTALLALAASYLPGAAPAAAAKAGTRLRRGGESRAALAAGHPARELELATKPWHSATELAAAVRGSGEEADRLIRITDSRRPASRIAAAASTTVNATIAINGTGRLPVKGRSSSAQPSGLTQCSHRSEASL